jgi:hypothetical protein
MTYVIEVHTREDRIIGSTQGTHEGRGAVPRLNLVWPTLLRIAEQRTWYRAYVIYDTSKVVCAVARDSDDNLSMVGVSPACTLGTHLPYLLPPPATKLVVSTDSAGRFGNVAQRDRWLAETFKPADVATVVLLHAGRVQYAWERANATSMQLVANNRWNPENVPKRQR